MTRRPHAATTGPFRDAAKPRLGAPRHPSATRNALKHGMYTKAALRERKAPRKLIRKMQESLQEIEDG